MYSICLRSCNCCLRMVFICWFGSFECLSMTCYRWPNCTSLLLASFCIYGSEAFEAQQVSWTVSPWHICLQDSSGNDYIPHCSFMWHWQTSCVANPLHTGWMRRFFLSHMKRDPPDRANEREWAGQQQTVRTWGWGRGRSMLLEWM